MINGDDGQPEFLYLSPRRLQELNLQQTYALGQSLINEEIDLARSFQETNGKSLFLRRLMVKNADFLVQTTLHGICLNTCKAISSRAAIAARSKKWSRKTVGVLFTTKNGTIYTKNDSKKVSWVTWTQSKNPVPVQKSPNIVYDEILARHSLIHVNGNANGGIIWFTVY